MARKIISGRSVEVRGLRQLEAKVRDIIDASKGMEAQAIVGDASKDLRQEVISAARSVKVPHEVLEDIFSWDKPHPRDKARGRISALVGIRKRGRSRPWAKGYREWFPGKRMGRGSSFKAPKMSKSLVLPGYINDKGEKQMVGESLATMWELGTSIMSARPFFRPTITGYRARLVERLAAGYRAILARHAK